MSNRPETRAGKDVKPMPTLFRQPKDVECWGHRGASAHLPENTYVPLDPSSHFGTRDYHPNCILSWAWLISRLASFRAAIEEGADGIESGKSSM